MRKFILKLVLFALPIVIIFLLALFTPTTPRASKSLLMSSINKDSLLKNTPSPRIIFVGGSNLSFGLNSQMIKDSLSLNPATTSQTQISELISTRILFQSGAAKIQAR